MNKTSDSYLVKKKFTKNAIEKLKKWKLKKTIEISELYQKWVKTIDNFKNDKTKLKYKRSYTAKKINEIIGRMHNYSWAKLHW